ncbi:hypothetical protein HGA15_18780 [Nocardia flavorosea]|uniref:Uncharacterized protein n=1 Tax=Nocardia flavorosea TaxID=53429 RepID=A0A846YKI2_9NOCA|nr:hypothetical protein [Nocardia flavorosea]
MTGRLNHGQLGSAPSAGGLGRGGAELRAALGRGRNLAPALAAVQQERAHDRGGSKETALVMVSAPSPSMNAWRARAARESADSAGSCSATLSAAPCSVAVSESADAAPERSGGAEPTTTAWALTALDELGLPPQRQRARS